jgi:hypothetical protein
MHFRYDDIIAQISGRPTWWFNGVPRYSAFDPAMVGSFEIALVHTECRECRTRYDVAIGSQPPSFASLRDVISFENRLNVGDPPFACAEMGARCSGGYCMTSLEMRVLEFWTKDGRISNAWRRDTDWERPLIHANWDSDAQDDEGVWGRILDSDRIDEWSQARRDGDFATMVAILKEFDCERPLEVAHMIDLERRYQLLRDKTSAIRNDRFGEN